MHRVLDGAEMHDNACDRTWRSGDFAGVCVGVRWREKTLLRL